MILYVDAVEAENFESLGSQGFVSPEKVVSPPSPPKIPPFQTLEEINLPLSAKPAVSFPEGGGRQDNADVPQGYR